MRLDAVAVQVLAHALLLVASELPAVHPAVILEVEPDSFFEVLLEHALEHAVTVSVSHNAWTLANHLVDVARKHVSIREIQSAFAESEIVLEFTFVTSASCMILEDSTPVLLEVFDLADVLAARVRVRQSADVRRHAVFENAFKFDSLPGVFDLAEPMQFIVPELALVHVLVRHVHSSAHSTVV